jgi:hypothetical protein
MGKRERAREIWVIDMREPFTLYNPVLAVLRFTAPALTLTDMLRALLLLAYFAC